MEAAAKIGVVLIGDIVGDAGMRAVFAGLRGLKRRTGAAVIIANGENAVDGYGLTPEVVDRILGFGVQVITSGNHVWQHAVLHHTLDSEQRLLRPENYLPDAPGHGWCVVRASGAEVGVLNVQGRHALPSPRCPFQTADSAVAALRTRTPVIVVDMHAESSEEKEALALHLDGRVTFTGSIAYDRIGGLLNLADFFISASVSEVHPLTFIEAAAAGLPAIGINSPGVADMIVDGRTGFLTDDNDLSLGLRIMRMARDTDMRSAMGRAATQYSQRYSAHHNAREVLALYQSLQEG